MSNALIKAEDLLSGDVYAKINPRAGDGSPHLVYLSSVFQGTDYEEKTRGLNFHDITGGHGYGHRSSSGSQRHYALYTRLDKNAFTSWVVSSACDEGNKIGFTEVNRKLIPEMEGFLDHVDMQQVIADLVRQKLSVGFPTILDALVRITGQKDLKKKIEKEPELVKLFDRIDESLS